MNPDEIVTLRYPKSGKIIQVKRSELPKYNLPTGYVSKIDSAAASVKSGNMKIGDIGEDYRIGVGDVLTKQGFNPAEAEAKTKEEQTKIKNQALIAPVEQLTSTLEDSYQKSGGGNYSGPLARLLGKGKSMASAFGLNSNVKFYEDTKTGFIAALKGLTGDVGVLTEQDAKRLGKLVPEVGDTPNEARMKFNSLRAQLAAKYGGKSTETPVHPEGSLSAFVNNAKSDVGGLVGGILNLPKTVSEYQASQGVDVNAPVHNPLQVQLNTLKMMGLMGKGYAQNLNEDVGRPLEGGNFPGRAAEHFGEHPVNTILDILPFLKPLKIATGATVTKLVGGGSKAAEATKAAEAASTVEKAGQVTSELTKRQMFGSKMRAGVSQIDVGPSLYGPQKEVKVLQTLDKYGIKGSPGDKYAQLQPKVAEIGDKIAEELNKNPMEISIEDIKSDFKVNLEDQLRSKNINARSADKEITSYLQDLYGKDIKDTISSQDMFRLKQKINQDYKAVAKKIDSNTALNDREKVISVARQTLDDVIAEYYPQVKELTLDQSALYDAVESLHKARADKSYIFLPGGIRFHPPQAQTQRAQDLIGRILQNSRGGTMPNK